MPYDAVVEAARLAKQQNGLLRDVLVARRQRPEVKPFEAMTAAFELARKQNEGLRQAILRRELSHSIVEN